MVIALLACAFQLASAQAPPAPDLSDRILDRIGVILQYAAFVPGVDFSTWNKVAPQHRREIDAALSAEDYATRLTGVLKSYGVSHIGVSPPGEAIGEPMQNYGFDSEQSDGHWVVTRVFAGSDADKAGLYSGLVLESKVRTSDDRIVVSFYQNQVLQAKSIPRSKSVPMMAPQLIDLDGAYVLQVADFDKGYSAALIDDLMMKAAAKPFLIIDLRGNVGGYPVNGLDLLGYFLHPGTRIGAVISRDTIHHLANPNPTTSAQRKKVVTSLGSTEALTVPGASSPYSGHIAVLIDGGTRSTGEVVALALREFAGAPVFGVASSGEALAMIPEELPGGYTLYFPWRDYWTAAGDRIEGHPIAPDYPATTEEDGPIRTPLQMRAFHWLHLTYPGG